MRELWLARHAESAGNVAATRAEAEGLEVIPLDIRDADVELSPTGLEQAQALGDWLQPRLSEVDTLWSSPYARARGTLAARSASSTAIGWSSSTSGSGIGSSACSTC